MISLVYAAYATVATVGYFFTYAPVASTLATAAGATTVGAGSLALLRLDASRPPTAYERQLMEDERRFKAEQRRRMDADVAQGMELVAQWNAPKTRTCRVCGISIEHRRDNARYCGDQCRSKARKGK